MPVTRRRSCGRSALAVEPRRRDRRPSGLPRPRRVRAARPRHDAGRAAGVAHRPGRRGRWPPRGSPGRGCATSSRTARCTTGRHAIRRWRRRSPRPIRDLDPTLVLVGLAGSASVAAGGRGRAARSREEGVRRSALRGGRLAPLAAAARAPCSARADAAAQAVSIARDGRVTADGRHATSPSEPTRSASTATAPTPSRSRRPSVAALARAGIAVSALSDA